MKIRILKKNYKKYIFIQLDEISELYLALRNWNRSKKLKKDNEIYFLKELHYEDLKEICKDIQNQIILFS